MGSRTEIWQYTAKIEDAFLSHRDLKTPAEEFNEVCTCSHKHDVSTEQLQVKADLHIDRMHG